MVLLQDEFMEHAMPPATENETHESDTDSDADNIDHLTCEYQDNPFTSFMKQLELLMETDPQEALRVLKLVIADRTFNQKAQLETLSERLDSVIELVQAKRETGPVISNDNSPLLTSHFFKSVCDMPAVKRKGANETVPVCTPKPFAATR